MSVTIAEEPESSLAIARQSTEVLGWSIPACGVVVEGYYHSVAWRSVERAGRCINLKGVVHEFLFVDLHNWNPVNWAASTTAQLTKSPMASVVDVVIMKGRRVAGRLQLKDTPSASGLAKTCQQIVNNKYPSAKVVVTSNCAAEIRRRVGGKSRKTILSSRISSSTTESVAARVGINGLPRLRMAATVGRQGAIIGAIAGCVTGAVSCVRSYRRGELTISKAIQTMAKDTLVGSVSGAAGSVVALYAGAAIGGIGTAPAWIPAATALVAMTGASYFAGKGTTAAWNWAVGIVSANSSFALCCAPTLVSSDVSSEVGALWQNS